MDQQLCFEIVVKTSEAYKPSRRAGLPYRNPLQKGRSTCSRLLIPIRCNNESYLDESGERSAIRTPFDTATFSSSRHTASEICQSDRIYDTRFQITIFPSNSHVREEISDAVIICQFNILLELGLCGKL